MKSNMIDVIAPPLTAYKWHIRFSFSASGLHFAKEACSALMCDSPIMAASWEKPPERSSLEPAEGKKLSLDEIAHCA